MTDYQFSTEGSIIEILTSKFVQASFEFFEYGSREREEDKLGRWVKNTIREFRHQSSDSDGRRQQLGRET